VDGLRIQPVREGNGSMKVIFLLDIPQSNNRPHMAADKRYHKRLNFRRIRMEHFEVVNLLKLRWVLNEKMIEKIYEPLASVLEKNAKEFEKYNSPNTSEIQEILSRTYYKWRMSIELLDELDYYVSQIKVLDKKLHFARREIKNICCRNVLEYLDIETQPSAGYPELRFRLFFEKSEGDLHPTIIYEYLMKNKSIKDYIDKLFYPGKCEKISINCMDKWHEIKLEDFDELIWKNCLKEAKENPEVVQMKESADTLWEWAQTLIETITTTS